MQAGIVDLEVLDRVEHLHVLVLQTGAMDPAGGLAQAVADLGLLALQQEHLTRRRMRLRLDTRHAATGLKRRVDAPLLPELLTVEAGGLALVSDELGHVETDTAGTDHRHRLADRLALENGVQVADHLGMLDPRNLRSTRGDTGGQDDLVETARHQVIHRHAGIEAHVDTGGFQLALEVAQGFKELFLARHALGHVELAADLTGGVEQGHAVAAFGRDGGSGQPGRAGADHGDLLDLLGGNVVQLGLVAGARVDQTTGQLAAKGVIQAGLVAADAGIDLVRAALGGLVDEVRVGEERTGHGHHVGIALGQHLLGDFRGVDAVGGDQRNRHLALELGGDLGESRTRHLGGDGRDTRLVPADTGIDQGGAGLLDGLGQQHDLVPGAATLDQIEHRQAIDDDEVRPDRLAHATHDFHRQAHAVLVAATPAVGAVVGVGHQELVDEITFRTHHLDTVITGLLGQRGAIDEVGDLLLDALFVQFLGLERIDRCLDGARRHRLRAVGIAPGMQDLHADLAAGLVHGLGDDLVLLRLLDRAQLGRAGVHAALLVRADATGDHQADAATGTLGEVGRHALEAARLLFQASVHGAHQGAVLQRGEAEIKRGQQVRVTSSHGILHIAVQFTDCRGLMVTRSVMQPDDNDAAGHAQ